MPLLRDAVGLGSAQDVDEVAGAERLAALALQPHDRGEQLLRGDKTVPRVGRGEARVAVAAPRGGFTEVRQEVLAAASDRRAQAESTRGVLGETHIRGAGGGGASHK